MTREQALGEAIRMHAEAGELQLLTLRTLAMAHHHMGQARASVEHVKKSAQALRCGTWESRTSRARRQEAAAEKATAARSHFAI
jgi:hypothetical protein